MIAKSTHMFHSPPLYNSLGLENPPFLPPNWKRIQLNVINRITALLGRHFVYFDSTESISRDRYVNPSHECGLSTKFSNSIDPDWMQSFHDPGYMNVPLSDRSRRLVRLKMLPSRLRMVESNHTLTGGKGKQITVDDTTLRLRSSSQGRPCCWKMAPCSYSVLWLV